MSLTSRAKQALVATAHPLRPVVSIGNLGLTDSVLAEIDRALYDHELIKIKIYSDQTKTERKALLQEIAERLKAEPLKVIGHIAILYRLSDKPSKN